MFIFCTYCLYTTIGGAQQEVEGTQWGRPGPGGTYWRPSAITGQGFMDKMVSGNWCPVQAPGVDIIVIVGVGRATGVVPSSVADIYVYLPLAAIVMRT